MAPAIKIRDMIRDDIRIIPAAFRAQGWNKPVSLYEGYFRDHMKGSRRVLVGLLNGRFAGYLTIHWRSGYPPFRKAGIPEVTDLNVLIRCRRRGIAGKLMDAAEKIIASRSAIAGIGVGLYPDYGSAQAMYVRRGYIPDCRGIWWNDRQLMPGDRAVVDDGLNLFLTKKLSRSRKRSGRRQG